MFCPFYSPFPFRFTFTFVCWPCAKHRKNKSSGLASHTWPVSHSISSFSGLRCHNCLSLVRQTPAPLSLRFPLKIVSFLLSKFSRLSISLAPSFSSLGSAPAGRTWQSIWCWPLALPIQSAWLSIASSPKLFKRPLKSCGVRLLQGFYFFFIRLFS